MPDVVRQQTVLSNVNAQSVRELDAEYEEEKREQMTSPEFNKDNEQLQTLQQDNMDELLLEEDQELEEREEQKSISSIVPGVMKLDSTMPKK